jgi:hypothetical protein
MTSNAATPCGLILFAALLGAVNPSFAEPAVSARSDAAEHDESIGLLSVAGGVASLDTSGAGARLGGSVAVAAGIRLRSRIALVFDASLVVQSEGWNDSVRRGGTQTVGLQVSPWPRLWLRGGAGVGWMRFSGGTDDAYHRDGLAPAALIAAGVELVQRPSWSLDLQLRAAAMSHYGETAVLTHGLFVGASWR